MVLEVGGVTETQLAPGTMAKLTEAGCFLLDQVAAELARYVAFPSPEARDAVALWAAHAHAVNAFESTPRLALLSPEKGSGKTRTLEVLDLLVPEPMHTVNATAAAIFRTVEAHQPTLLFDEADTIFGPLARGDHEELRGLVNAGHRKGAVAYRCVGDPAKMEVKAFPAFCAVAIAGIGDLPDTILDRAVLVRMRRRGPGEQVEPFRHRLAAPRLRDLHQALAAWAWTYQDRLTQAEPEMPPGLVDRPADVWEALLAIADLAGGDWPMRARKAAVKLNRERGEADPSLGVKLLADTQAAFDTDKADRLATDDLLKRLCAMEESPWGNLRGVSLDARGLAARLRPFDVRPCQYRDDSGARHRGYLRADLADAWSRYLPTP
jgi:hypothetical protein